MSFLPQLLGRRQGQEEDASDADAAQLVVEKSALSMHNARAPGARLSALSAAAGGAQRSGSTLGHSSATMHAPIGILTPAEAAARRREATFVERSAASTSVLLGGTTRPAASPSGGGRSSRPQLLSRLSAGFPTGSSGDVPPGGHTCPPSPRAIGAGSGGGAEGACARSRPSFSGGSGTRVRLGSVAPRSTGSVGSIAGDASSAPPSPALTSPPSPTRVTALLLNNVGEVPSRAHSLSGAARDVHTPTPPLGSPTRPGLGSPKPSVGGAGGGGVAGGPQAPLSPGAGGQRRRSRWQDSVPYSALPLDKLMASSLGRMPGLRGDGGEEGEGGEDVVCRVHGEAHISAGGSVGACARSPLAHTLSGEVGAGERMSGSGGASRGSELLKVLNSNDPSLFMKPVQGGMAVGAKSTHSRMRPLPSMARPATSSSSGAAASTPGRERSSLTGARGGAASSGPLGAGVVPGGGAPPAGWSVAGARPEMLPRLIASGHPVGGDRFRWSEPPVCTNTKIQTPGISLRYIFKFEEALPPGPLSTELVAQHFILPLTAESQNRFTAIAPQQYVNSPKYFISHAWSADFHDLCAQLRRYASEQGLDAHAAFVWLDVFCANLHAPCLGPKDMSHLADVISSCKQLLLVLDSRGAALSRLWCWYEVWAALMMVSRTKYEQVPDRLHILAYDPDWELIAGCLVGSRPEGWAASLPTDAAALRSELGREAGLVLGAGGGAKLGPHLAAALVEAARTELTASDKFKTANPRRHISAHVKYGLMLAAVGRYYDAEKQLRGLLGYARDRGLMTPADAAPLTAALGWLLAAEGFPGEAARLAGEAGGVYAGREEAGRSGGGPHLTPSERRTQAACAALLAEAAYQQGDMAAAEALAKRVIADHVAAVRAAAANSGSSAGAGTGERTGSAGAAAGHSPATASTAPQAAPSPLGMRASGVVQDGEVAAQIAGGVGGTGRPTAADVGGRSREGSSSLLPRLPSSSGVAAVAAGGPPALGSSYLVVVGSGGEGGRGVKGTASGGNITAGVQTIPKVPMLHLPGAAVVSSKGDASVGHWKDGGEVDVVADTPRRVARRHAAAAAAEAARQVAEHQAAPPRPSRGYMTCLRRMAALKVAAKGDLGRAVAYLKEAVAASEAALGARHPDTCSAQEELAAVMQEAGSPQAALSLLAVAQATRAWLHGPTAPPTLRVRAARGSALLAVGAFEECEAELCGVLAAAEAGLGSSHEVTEECRAQVRSLRDAWVRVGGEYLAAGHVKQAEVALRRALGLCLTLAHGCVDVGGDACARGVVRELSELARRQGRPSDPLALLEAATAAHHAQAAAAAAAGVAVGAEGESGIV